MEPERKIEKLLRAYAKNRRARAGDAFKLHPVTRRLLQGEAARRKPAADDSETSLSLWELFRTNWAVLAGFTLIIFFCASLFMPALSKAKNKAKSVEAMNSLRQIGVAAQIAAADNHGRLPATLDDLTNAMGSGLALTDTVSGQRFVYVAGGEVLDGLQTNAVLAYSPGDKKGSAVLFADGSVRQVRRDEFSALTNRGSSVLTVAAAASSPVPGKAPVAEPSTTPATGLPVLAGGRLTKANGINTESAAPSASPAAGNNSSAGEFGFARPSDGPVAGVGGAGAAQATMLFKARLVTGSNQFGLSNSQSSAEFATAMTPPVLASFELRQSGRSLSIVDHDGSIYEGTLQTPKKEESTGKDWGELEKSAGQNYSFHVTGTNRTLNESVVFAGNLIVVSNAESNVHFRFEAGKGERLQMESTNASLPAAISNLCIIGTVTVASTNQIEVMAVPAKP